MVEKGSDLTAFSNKCRQSSLILHQNLPSAKFLKVLMRNLKPCQLTVHTVTSNTRGLTPLWCFERIFYLSLSSQHWTQAIGKHHLPELSRSSQRWHILLYNIKKKHSLNISTYLERKVPGSCQAHGRRIKFSKIQISIWKLKFYHCQQCQLFSLKYLVHFIRF